jgi:hypothetical protein
LYTAPPRERGLRTLGGQSLGVRPILAILLEAAGTREGGEQNGGQAFNPFGTIGNERMRLPVAAKMALPMAGARPQIGVSPAPAEG